MPSAAVAISPGLRSFLKSLKAYPIDCSIDYFIALLKRRQIRNSRPCAIATIQLLLRVVSAFKFTDVENLIARIKLVGRRIQDAQPRELAVGNIVRRVLGLIRSEIEEGRNSDRIDGSSISEGEGSSGPATRSAQDPSQPSTLQNQAPEHARASSGIHERIASLHLDADSNSGDDTIQKSARDQALSRPPLLTSHTSRAGAGGGLTVTSMFSLLSHPLTPSPIEIPPDSNAPNLPDSLPPLSHHHVAQIPKANHQSNLKADIINGIEEIIDEISQVDDLIAACAPDHIHSNEIILTHSSSSTVQKFLLRAAAKRKFTVIHAESHPNDHEATHAAIAGTVKSHANNDEDTDTASFQKALTAAGISVILIPDSAVFAIMSRVNKVILATHIVLANGGLVAPAGARVIAKSAKVHQTPVVVLSGVYKLSPKYPFDLESLIEYGDASKVFAYEDGDLVDRVSVENPLFDYVPAELVDLYITNL
ncbi:MAG: GCD complex subunit gcd7 [Trizodia sp. TS-e1964]|nr:MAG: GCD complex subunit gcd7 [Trizodia sp. TS-e1964]